MKSKLLASLCLSMLLLGCSTAAIAQSTSQARIKITSDGPIAGYRSYRQGDRSYVVVLSPVSPATETDLASGGFEDIQISQQGSDLVISFRLAAGSSAAVRHKGNVIELVVQIVPQQLPSTTESTGADGGETQRQNGVEERGALTVDTTRTSERLAPGPGPVSAPPVSPNTARPADSAVVASTAPAAAIPAPISMQEDIQRENNLTILNDIDLAVPESPAFTILGVTPQTVVRPATPKEFASSLLNGVDEHGNFQSGLALDAVPFLIFAGDGVTLYEYNRNYLKRLLSRTQTSFATTKGTGDNDKSIRLALGLHMTLWDRGDPRADDQLFACYDKADQSIQAEVADFLIKTPGGVKAPTFPAFLAGQKATFTTETNACDAEARKRNWKQTGFVIGAAPSWISTTGTTDKFRWNGGGFWASLAYGFEGVSGLEDNSQLIFHARFRSNEQIPDSATPGSFLTQDSSLIGTRLRLGNPDTNVSFEGVYMRLKRPGENRDNSYRYLLGLERRVAQNIWFQLSLGADSGRRDGNNQAFIKGTFNWGFVRKEEATSPTILSNSP